MRLLRDHNAVSQMPSCTVYRINLDVYENVPVKVAPMRILQLAVRNKNALGQLFGEVADIVMALANRTVFAERGRARAPHYHSFLRLRPQSQTLHRQELGLQWLGIALWTRHDDLLQLNWDTCTPDSKNPHRCHCSCTAKSISRKILLGWPVNRDVRISV